jgi:hypothetical protein
MAWIQWSGSLPPLLATRDFATPRVWSSTSKLTNPSSRNDPMAQTDHDRWSSLILDTNVMGSSNPYPPCNSSGSYGPRNFASSPRRISDRSISSSRISVKRANVLPLKLNLLRDDFASSSPFEVFRRPPSKVLSLLSFNL